MAPHSSILAWEIPWTDSLVGYSPWGHKRVRHDLVTKQHSYITKQGFQKSICYRHKQN